MTKLLKLFWVVSVVVFMAILLYAYGILPQEVRLFESPEDQLTLDKTNFFYTALIILFSTNILLFGARFMAAGFLNRSDNAESLTLWITGFAGVLNIFYGLCAIAMTSINSDLDAPVGILFYGGIALVVLWLVLPALSFFKRF